MLRATITQCGKRSNPRDVLTRARLRSEDVELHFGFVDPGIATKRILEYQAQYGPSSPQWLKAADCAKCAQG